MQKTKINNNTYFGIITIYMKKANTDSPTFLIAVQSSMISKSFSIYTIYGPVIVLRIMNNENDDVRLNETRVR